VTAAETRWREAATSALLLTAWRLRTAAMQVCWHPGKPHLFASACESARVSLWDARTRTLQRSAPLGFAGHACAFSSSAVGGATGKHHLAVGGKHGHVKVVDETNLQVSAGRLPVSLRDLCILGLSSCLGEDQDKST
jgi:hypothetical protein